jgi:hypothetical protein
LKIAISIDRAEPRFPAALALAAIYSGTKTSRALLVLGQVCELRQRLPLLVELDGEPFRILELNDEELVAYTTICPDWLGPLEDTVSKNGKFRRPWQRYLFDVRAGSRADGYGIDQRRRRWYR